MLQKLDSICLNPDKNETSDPYMLVLDLAEKSEC